MSADAVPASSTPAASTCANVGPRIPAVAVQHLFEEIKTLGSAGCLNLLDKYINQGRAGADLSHNSRRRLARMLLTKPDNLKTEHRDLLARLTSVCHEMTQLAAIIVAFAKLLTPREGHADGLSP